MNENEKQNDKRTVSRNRYILSIIVALLIGVIGTISVVYFVSGEQSSEEVATPEEATETELDTQLLFGDQEELSPINKLYTILKTNYYEEVDSQVLVEGALDGMAAAVGDPYTEYMDQVESSSFEEDVSGSFEGIGAEVMKDGDYVRIISPIANSPAEEAGLQPNDLILEVAGESVADLPLNEAVELIRGPEDSSVELLIQRGEEQFTVSLVRATIPLETVFYEVDEEDDSIGYVNIVNFNMPTYKETTTAIQELEDQGVEKIVFDVRGNPGGLLTTALQISNIFVPDGEPLMMTEYREDEEPTVYNASEEYGDFKYDGEAILLVDEGSASASEILAGAMRSVDIPIYGDTTFGKGTVQSVVELGEEDEVKFTSGKWLTADGEWINEEGIEPDVEVSLPDYATLFIINSSATYEEGQTSAEVKNLKNVLSALDYEVSDNETFDETVVEAVEAFQTENDLSVDGIVTGETARLLTEALRTKIEENDTQYEAAVEALQE